MKQKSDIANMLHKGMIYFLFWATLFVGILSGHEANAVGPNSIRLGFDTLTLAANDDGSTGLVSIGFPIDFFGTNYTQTYVNNNGNITFDSPLSTYTPFDLFGTSRVIIAPFFADVDTRISGNPTQYGPGTVNGRNAWGATWRDVDCFDGFDGGVRTVRNYFQVVLIDRSDTGVNNFDIEFNYDQIQWEAGQASGGTADCQMGSSARVGYSNGSTQSLEFPGSAINGAFLDTNTTTGLINNSLNSNQQLGRYVINVRAGLPIESDLIISKAGPLEAVLDEVIIYTLTVNNGGPDPATGVTVSDTLPLGLSYISATPDQGALCTISNRKITCILGNIPSLGLAKVTIKAKVTSRGVVITNTATVSGDQADPNPGNNSDFVTTSVLNRAPTANAGPDQVKEATGPGGASVTLDASGSSDPDGDTLTYNWSGPFGAMTGVNPTPPVPFGLGVHTVNLSVSDGVIPASDTVVITVQDTTAPTMTGVPANITVEATGVLTPVSLGIPPTGSDIAGSVTISNDAPAGGYPVGATIVTWTATDGSGNTATTTQTVTVKDTIAPTTTASPAGGVYGIAQNVTLTCVDSGSGCASTVYSFDGFTTAGVAYTGTAIAVTTTATLSFKSTDGVGNTETVQTETYTIDTTPPTLVGMPFDVVTVTTSSSGAIVNYPVPTATDAIDPTPVVDCLPASGGTFVVGVTTVTCTATDASGNFSSATFTVTVQLDSDGDGWLDSVDNCPLMSNPDQADMDGDGIGDVCDPDNDNDNIANGAIDPDGVGPILAGPDNCLLTPNNGQEDMDLDGRGDLCDLDTDGDGYGDSAGKVHGKVASLPNSDTVYDAVTGAVIEPQPIAPGAGQLWGGDCNDLDSTVYPGSGCGDTFSVPELERPNKKTGGTQTDPTLLDDDGDGLTLGQEDTNGNGVVDSGETDPNNADTDIDGVSDGPSDPSGPIVAGPDNCPFTPSSDQTDTDADGMGNACDVDADNDGVLDKDGPIVDPTTLLWSFNDIPVEDPDPLRGDNAPLIYNPDQLDADSDNIADVLDPDRDGDGYGDMGCCPDDNTVYDGSTGASKHPFDPAVGLTLGEIRGGDCGDLDLLVNPGMPEIKNNGKDDDCNPATPDTDFKLTLTMLGYDSWLPSVGGAAASATVAVIDSATGSPVDATSISSLILSVSDVTNIPGTYTNDSDVANTTPDFSAILTVNADNTGGTISITPLDYGGSITILAQATINGTLVQNAITFPKDSDVDDLADAWEIAQTGGLSLACDGDEDNDGSTNCEEMRGFIWGPGLVSVSPSLAGLYQTEAWVPGTGTPTHFRTHYNKRDLFILSKGFDDPDPLKCSAGCPFAIGTALVGSADGQANIAVHVRDDGILPAVDEAAGSGPVKNIDVLVVTNDNVFTFPFTDGHINKRGVRDWSWDTKGSSGVGDAIAYGSGTTMYQKSLDLYFADLPYLDGSSLGTLGLLDPINTVEDQNDNGSNDKKAGKFESTKIINNTVLDGDTVVLGSYTNQLTAFDIDNDGRVELPVTSDFAPYAYNTYPYEYTKAQVLKHTITHEIGHAIGLGHTQVSEDLMYEFTNNWERDGHFSDISPIQIHND